MIRADDAQAGHLRIIVTGGRDYNDRCMVEAVMRVYDPVEVWHGGASGADQLAAQWAETWLERIEEFKADWKAHGRAAGPMRNQRMIDAAVQLRDKFGVRFIVAAFPGGRGTADCVKRARAAGLNVLTVTDNGFDDYVAVGTREKGLILQNDRHRMMFAGDGFDVRDM